MNKPFINVHRLPPEHHEGICSCCDQPSVVKFQFGTVVTTQSGFLCRRHQAELASLLIQKLGE